MVKERPSGSFDLPSRAPLARSALKMTGLCGIGDGSVRKDEWGTFRPQAQRSRSLTFSGSPRLAGEVRDDKIRGIMRGTMKVL
jgi:hypothetical protein